MNKSELYTWASGPQFQPTDSSKKRKTILFAFMLKLSGVLCATAKEMEKAWGNRMLGCENKIQWSTSVSEQTVRMALEDLNYRPYRPIKMHGMKPDWECKDFIIEVKSRSWCTPGTIGEKVLGTPWKYCDVPKYYNKPLLIVLVAGQEWECRHKFSFWSKNICENRQKMIDLYESMNIYYIPFTLLLKPIEFKKLISNK